MHRRRFITTTAASSLALGLTNPLQALPADHRYMKTIGLQLWTVRNQLEQDMPKTIKAVADAGYRQVELMRVLGSENIVQEAKNNNLRVTSAFLDWTSIANPKAENAPSFDKILEQAKSFDLKYLVFGYIGKGHRETIDHYKKHAAAANQAGKKCKNVGIQLCYHNHSFEFAKLPGGKTGWEVLVEEFDPELVKFELDVFWVAIGGYDPLESLGNLKGRVAQVHLKDLKKGTSIEHDEGKVPHEAFKELGNGTIDMSQVLDLSAKIGVDQCHVEQDQSPDPVNSVAISMKYLTSL